MKLSLFALSTVLSLSASADVIHCSFTEPFFDLTIDTSAKTLLMARPSMDSDDLRIEKKVISKKISITKLKSKTISSALEVPRYSVRANGKEVLVLELDYQGSDGMSDFIYPYSTIYLKNHGGCDSDKVKRLVNSVEESN